MNNQNSKQEMIILFGILVVPVVWAAILVAPFVSGGLIGIVLGLGSIASPFSITWCDDTPKTIAIFLVIYGCGIGVYFSTVKNYRRKEEHGSAKWGNVHGIGKKYAHKTFAQNKILTQNFRLGLDGRKHMRNLNTLVIGGSGAGKTRFYAKPNVLQANTSFVILDPKNEILRDTGRHLEKQGYEIRVLDLINTERSHGYNPFVYLKDEADVLRLVSNIINNTTDKKAMKADAFWEKSEQALLSALILYLLSEAPPEEQNFSMVMELIRAAKASDEEEGEEDEKSITDELFERLEDRDPDHLAVKQYQVFKLAPGKTANSILISLGVRLEKFSLPHIERIITHDEMDLPSLGEKKVALFAVIPDSDTSLNFIVGCLYTQAFQQLYYSADHKHGGRLPVHVHLILDEFANVALPDDFDKILSTMRSREISVSIIIQNLAQLKSLFDKQWESIVGNTDTLLYLGGNEQGTHEFISKSLGKETIDTNTYGQSKGRNGSYTTNFQNVGRELMTPDEVRMLDNSNALLFIRGERPIMDKKFNLLKHPNIKYASDGGKPQYQHGQAPHAIDTNDIWLSGNLKSLDVMSPEEVLEFLKNQKSKENDNEKSK